MPRRRYRPDVTLVAGPPCAGKTTYVAERAGPTDLVVDWDDLYVALTNAPRYSHPAPLARFVKAAQNAVLHKLRVDPERDMPAAWIIKCAPDPAERQRYAHRFDADVVVLETPGGVCLDRLRDQDRPNADEIAEVIVEWWHEYERRNDETHIELSATDRTSESMTPEDTE